MVIGALGCRWLLPLKPLLPWLIFFMLFFTFCKINPLDLRFLSPLSSSNFLLYLCALIWSIMGFCRKNSIYSLFAIMGVMVLFAACGHVSSPKPYGYYRITVPDTAYVPFEAKVPHYPTA